MEMPLKNTAKVVALEWDKDGDSVAILQVQFAFPTLAKDLKFKNLNFRRTIPLWCGILAPKA
jgi:hypothetical protein